MRSARGLRMADYSTILDPEYIDEDAGYEMQTPRTLFLTHGHVFGPDRDGAIGNLPQMPVNTALLYGHTHVKANEPCSENKIDKFELAKVGQATEHNYCGVNCGFMDQFASVFGKAGSLIRLDCRSLEYQYFPFHPEGYRLVLMDSVVKHELASSAYNKRRQSCEAAVAAIQKKHPHVEFLRDCTMAMLEEAKADISAEDYMRAEYVIEEIQRVLDVCEALEKDDYETVGKKMYETHHGMSKLYEVSCEELDFLNDCAKEYGVTGSRVMGGGFGGCTINLVKDELYDNFVEKTKAAFKAKFGRSPKVYDVVIGDGSRRLE